MDGIFMSKNEQFCFTIIEDFRDGKISRKEAALLLVCSERAVTRRAGRIRKLGLRGAKHGNSDRAPSTKLDPLLKARVIELIRKKYYDFNMSHLRELLLENENIALSYTSLWRWCHEAGVVKFKKKIRASKLRLYRERMAKEGLLLQMDGSHHKWNNREKWCLIAMIDDATSEIPYAEFFKSEDTLNCMKVLESVITIRGIPQALYVDKAGWFGGTKRSEFSQFERACNELDIRVIYANSPQAKGRIERAWKTFQDRLIPELRLNRIKGMDEANKYLLEVFLATYWNQKNKVKARHPESSYRPLEPGHDLEKIFCRKEERWVANNRCFQFERGIYQILNREIINLAGCKIEIHSYKDGSWSVFRKGEKLTFKEIILPFKAQEPKILKPTG